MKISVRAGQGCCSCSMVGRSIDSSLVVYFVDYLPCCARVTYGHTDRSLLLHHRVYYARLCFCVLFLFSQHLVVSAWMVCGRKHDKWAAINIIMHLSALSA